ncbi:MAG: hypothetical protein AABX27_04890 [Nanoarchaeota archaeon]
MKIINSKPNGEWVLVRLASKQWLEHLVNAYTKAGADEVVCRKQIYNNELPPLEPEYEIYIKGTFDKNTLEKEIFN